MMHDAHNDAQKALYALLAGAEGCGRAARSARLVRDKIVDEARRHLERRVAE